MIMRGDLRLRGRGFEPIRVIKNECNFTSKFCFFGSAKGINLFLMSMLLTSII